MKYLGFLSLLFLHTLSLHAQPPETSLLWRIEGNGISDPSYLYGTIHLLCKEDLQLTESLRSAFEGTNRLVLELDMDDPSMFTGMQQNMVMAEGKELEDLLDEDEYEQLNRFFADSVGTGLGLVSRFKPFVLQSFMYPRLLGCNPVSYEETFVRWAKQDKREVLGLESVEYQMAVFDRIPYEKQAAWLMEAVAEYGEAQAELRELVAVYRTQNLDSLQAYMVQSMDEYDEYGSLLLDDRNREWVPRMEVYMGEGPTFFGVGAGHLGGEAGLIRLLREAGYTLTPVSVQAPGSEQRASGSNRR